MFKIDSTPLHPCQPARPRLLRALDGSPTHRRFFQATLLLVPRAATLRSPRRYVLGTRELVQYRLIWKADAQNVPTLPSSDYLLKTNLFRVALCLKSCPPPEILLQTRTRPLYRRPRITLVRAIPCSVTITRCRVQVVPIYFRGLHHFSTT